MSSIPSDSPDSVEELNHAIRADRADVVRDLLARDPDLKPKLNEPIGPFDSPAITSARSREMLDVLLDAGADVNARSRWWAGGFGLLDWASPELAANAIERGAKLDVHSAARLGMIDRLRALIAAEPALVHAPGGDGQTPLHFAGTIDVAAFLLDRGTDLNALDVDHESTPAQYMSGERQDVARYLVSRGCKTDLLLAAALGDLDLARRHLDADPGCIRIRVSEDFFPKINPRSGGTIYGWTLGFYLSAHQVARKFGHDDVVGLLFERSPAAVQLIEACWSGDDATVKALRGQHHNIADQLSEADRRQVAHAARNNEAQVVRLMLESGLPVDARGQHNGTPLHWAAFHGNAEMARIILRYGPPLETLDADFHATPVGWAIHGSLNGWNREAGDYAGTVDALLQAGAKPPGALGGSDAVQEVLRRDSGNEGSGHPG
jgi:ankyrin repeat protein